MGSMGKGNSGCCGSCFMTSYVAMCASASSCHCLMDVDVWSFPLPPGKAMGCSGAVALASSNVVYH